MIALTSLMQVNNFSGTEGAIYPELNVIRLVNKHYPFNIITCVVLCETLCQRLQVGQGKPKGENRMKAFIARAPENSSKYFSVRKGD